MSRFCPARTLSAVAIAAAAGGLLASCGGGDSTVSSNPSPSANATSSAAPSGSASGTRSAEGSAPVTSPGAAATAPPETPQAVPSGFPGPTEAPAAGSRDKALLEELERNGVTSSGNGENAIAFANYICAAVRDGVDDAQITTYVTAMAGSELGITGSQMTPEAAAQVYIDAAKKTYCK